MRGLLQDYSSASRLGDRRNPNLAPLIDVVFQLILFFLVTSSFTWYSGMKVKLPEASSAVIDRPLETITLEITRTDADLGSPSAKTGIEPEKMRIRWWEEGVEGELLWPPEEDPTAGLAPLRSKLEEYKKGLAEDKNPSIVIAAEDSVPYQIVITVIDMCEQLGLSDIVLAIQRRMSQGQI
jgi:biopolymer transport protein ExbD